MQRGYSGKRIAHKLALFAIMASLPVLIPHHADAAKTASWRWIESSDKKMCALTDAGGNADRLKSAIAKYQKDPDNEAAFHCLVKTAIFTGDRRRSQRMVQVALARHPEWASVHTALARLADGELDDDKALAEYREATRIKPCWAEARLGLAELLVKNGKYKEALGLVDETLNLCSGTDSWVKSWRHEFLLCKGRICIGMADFPEAVTAMEKAKVTGLYPRDTLLQCNLAKACVKARQWTKALKYIDEGLKLEPSQDFYYALRAETYAGMGKPQLALRDVDKYLAFINRDIHQKATKVLEERDARLLRIQILKKLGQKELAAKEQAQMKGDSKFLYEEAPFRNEEKKAKHP